jgi:hypothetical protein
MDKHPARLEDVVWKSVNGYYMIEDLKSKKMYKLDQMSFLIWAQCDGRTGVEEIVDVFYAEGSRELIKTTVTNILDKLEGSGLVK